MNKTLIRRIRLILHLTDFKTIHPYHAIYYFDLSIRRREFEEDCRMRDFKNTISIGTEPFISGEYFTIKVPEAILAFEPNNQRGWKNNRNHYVK